ncbi:MAG TPA: metallophosphoesterase [Spirochaetia bacterium]|nr:metallophosphoesterase [Spirochaetia bacterium]
MKNATARERLEALLRAAPRRKVVPGEKIVVLSDLHMGSGGRNDDFLHNGPLCLDALEHYYWVKGFTLVLNGDIEELLRVSRDQILQAWKPMYDLFDRFRAQNRLVWLQGNHEILPEELRTGRRPEWFDGESLVLDFPEGRMFLFHGHQAGVANSGRYNGLIGWSLRTFANALGIGNRSIAHDSLKKFKLEKAVYEFSRAEGLVSVIGHTHRPLFESLSRRESLGIRLERLCRDYSRADVPKRLRIRDAVRELRRELGTQNGARASLSTLVYGQEPVPCVFNSGCAVGKRGFTTLEVKNGRIALVFWSSPGRSPRVGLYNEYKPSRHFGTLAYRTILRRERLDYVFSRIELLEEVP